MSYIIKWLDKIGEKAYRTDIWVALIVLTYGIIMTLYLVKPDEYPNAEWLLQWMITAMYIDLGINIFKGFLPSRNK